MFLTRQESGNLILKEFVSGGFQIEIHFYKGETFGEVKIFKEEEDITNKVYDAVIGFKSETRPIYANLTNLIAVREWLLYQEKD
jgi:hypothetical protein